MWGMRTEKTEPWLWNSPNPRCHLLILHQWTSWCEPLSCSHHMSHTLTRHSSLRPSHVQPAVKYLFCPELQQIFTAFVKFWTHSRRKTVSTTMIGFIWGWSCNNMFCGQCSSLLVPRGWSRLSDITTLSSRLPTCACSWGSTDRHCVSDELLSLISNTGYLSPIFLCRGHNYTMCSHAPVSCDPLSFHVN